MKGTEFKHSETVHSFIDDGSSFFKIGTCPWNNKYCEYGVVLTYRSEPTNSWISKYYCTMGSYTPEDECPILLE